MKREHLRSFHSPAGGHNPADRSNCDRRGHRLQRAAGIAPASGRFSHYLRFRQPAGRERQDHGVLRGNSAGTAVRPHCRHYRDDLVQLAGQHQRDSAIRSKPQHRRRSPRRGSGHQCGQNLSARQPAVQSQLSQGQSGRFAHHDHRPHLRQVRQRSDVRFRVHHHGAEAFADSGSRSGGGRRRIVSIGKSRR